MAGGCILGFERRVAFAKLGRGSMLILQRQTPFQSTRVRWEARPRFTRPQVFLSSFFLGLQATHSLLPFLAHNITLLLPVAGHLACLNVGFPHRTKEKQNPAPMKFVPQYLNPSSLCFKLLAATWTTLMPAQEIRTNLITFFPSNSARAETRSRPISQNRACQHLGPYDMF